MPPILPPDLPDCAAALSVLSYVGNVMRRMMRPLGRLGPLIRAGLIGGLIVAALIYPVAAVAGLALKSGADAVVSLPRQLLIVPSPQTSYVYAADAKTLLTTFYEEDRRYIPISQMSPLVQQAVVAAEDSRFYEHHGVDL